MTADAVTNADRVWEPTRTSSGEIQRAQRWFGPVQHLLAAASIVVQAAVGASTLGFHVVTSRLLGPAGYGELASLLAIVAVLAVPANTIETLVAARVAQRLERGEPLSVTATLRRSLAIGVGLAALLLAVAPLLRDYLALQSSASLVYLALYCVPFSAGVVPGGLLCGQRRFAVLGGVSLVGALARIGFADLFISWDAGVAGVIAALVCGDFLRTLLLALAARTRTLEAPGARPIGLGAGHAVSAVTALAGMWLLTGVDSMLARHLLPPVVAGQYNAVATTTHAIYFVSQAICLAALAAFASADRQRARTALRLALLATAGFGAAATVGGLAVGPWLLPYVFGAGIHVPAALMALVGLAATGVGLVWVMLQYQLARGAPAWAAWSGLAVAVVCGSLWATSPKVLAVVMIVASVMAIAVAVWAIRRYDARQIRPSMMTPGMLARVPPDVVDLTVVVPFYNPGDVLRDNLLNLLAALRVSGVTFEVVTVADGCTDGSAATIADLGSPTVRQLDVPCNGGKGAALRLGLQEGRGRYLGFIDADGDLDPKLWQPFLALIRLYEPDAVVGAKCHPLSEVHASARGIRRVYSVGYRSLVRLLFPALRVQETQVGIKVFRRELLADVLPRTVERGFVFDLELLTVAHRLGYRRILPAPVRLQRSGPSTINVPVVWRMFVDTVALAWRVWVARAYDAAPASQGRDGRPETADCNDDTVVLPMSRLAFREVW